MAEIDDDHDGTYDQLADETDARLIELYQETGLLTAEADEEFSVEEVVRLMRAAYWAGVVDDEKTRRESSRRSSTTVGSRRRRGRTPRP